MMKILLPLSWLFGLIVVIRNWLYDHGVLAIKKLPGTVISVGNIAVGGTGKSPIVIDIARMLQSKGARPAIVTRGYRSGLRSGEWQVLVDGKVRAGVSRSHVIADEAMMQSKSLGNVPVIVGSRRADAVNHFLSSFDGHGITHWIIDDGFQHRRLARDIDLVLIDVRNPYGDLMPAGMFREPVTALARAHGVVLTKLRNSEELDAIRQLIRKITSCPIYESSFIPLEPRCMFGDASKLPSRWAAVAGIAYPEDFLKSANSIGIAPVTTKFYLDHAPIVLSDLNSLGERCDGVLTTEKDWARSESIFRASKIPTFVLPLAVDWGGQVPEFISKI